MFNVRFMERSLCSLRSLWSNQDAGEYDSDAGSPTGTLNHKDRKERKEVLG
jgi:hypothetical protein